jgi:hypothetical protein
MSGYAQLMKKTGAMTKKGKKETPVQNLVRELLTDHGVQSPGVSQGPAVVAAHVAATSPPIQAAKKRKIVLCNPRSLRSLLLKSWRQSNLLPTTRYQSRMMKKLRPSDLL